MKPSWDTAPDWAEYLAMDEDGEWYWYENKPTIAKDCWFSKKGQSLNAGYSVCWDSSLESREESC